MNHKFKRGLSLLLSLVMVLALLPATALAAIGGTKETGLYTVKFYAEDGMTGTSYETQYIKDGESLIQPAIPDVLEQFDEFAGWYVGGTSDSNGVWSGGTKLTFGSALDADTLTTLDAVDGTTDNVIKVHARFINAVYVYFFDTMPDDDEDDPMGQPNIVAIKSLTNGPINLNNVTAESDSTGKVFDKWVYADGSEVTPYSNYIANEDTYLYATYTTGYTLTFDANGTGATATATQYVKAGSVTATVAPPQRPGYTFAGWYTDAEGGNQFEFGKALTGNTTVYAHWTAATTTYTVIIWQQKVTDDKNADDADKKYDYKELYIATAKTGVDVTETLATAAVVTNENGTTSMVNCAALDFEGFQYGNWDSDDAAVASDGSTVVNVYYDRQVITLNFYTLTRDKQQDVKTLRYTLSGLYGASLNGQWPTDYWWYDGLTYEKGAYTSSGHTRTSFLDIFMPASGANEVSYYGLNKTGDRTIEFYKQDDTGGDNYSLANKVDSTSTTFHISDKYVGFTASAYSKDGINWTPVGELMDYNSSKYYDANTTQGGYQGASLSENDTLRIRFTRNDYKIDFQNGTHVHNATAAYGTSLTSLKPTAEDEAKTPYPGNTADADHYYFAGWYADPEGTVLFDWNTPMPAHNLVVYAVWKPEKVNVTFNANGGTFADAQGNTVKTLELTYDYNSKIDNIPTPELAGHTLLGWVYKDADGNEVAWNVQSVVTEDMMLIAKWHTEAVLKVFYFVDDALSTDVQDPNSYLDGSEAIIQTDLFEGRRFIGWRLGDTIYEPGETIDINVENDAADGQTNNAIVLTAVFADNETATITFNANGGTFADSTDEDELTVTVVNNGGVDLDTVNPTQEGYMLMGWATADGTVYKADGTAVEEIFVSGTGNTLYAVWEKDVLIDPTVPEDDLPEGGGDGIPDKYQITVTFQIKNGTWEDGTTDDQKVVLTLRNADGELATAEDGGTAKLKQQQIPTGMKTDSENFKSGWNVTPSENTALTTNTTYIYTVTDQYTVTYDWNNNDISDAVPVDTTNYTTGDTVTVSTQYAVKTVFETNSGARYRFDGWTEDGTTVVSSVTVNNHNVDLVAKLTQLFTVTYDGNGNTSGTAPVDSNSPYDANDPATILGQGDLAKTGYTFAGWKTQADGSGQDYAANSSITMQSDITLYAQWNPASDTKYTVNHYKQELDGNYPSSPSATEELTGTTGETTEAEAKAYEGFTVVTPIGQKTIAADGTTVVDIYYTRNAYTITYKITGDYFENNSYKVIPDMKYGEQLTQITDDMSKAGYLWQGWTGLPTTMPANDVTVEGYYTTDPNTGYTVKHWLQDIKGDEYTEAANSQQDLTGETGQSTNAQANSYAGFTAQNFNQETIAAEGTTVINIYYNRNTHDITYKIINSGEFDDDEYELIEDVRYGAPLSLIEDNMEEAGYVWSGWSTLPSTMPDEDVEVTGYYSAATDTKYTVNHYLQNVDDDKYTLDTAQALTGTTGAKTAAVANTIAGFTARSFDQETIAADGSTVVNIYYDRKTHKITYQIVDSGEFNDDEYELIENVKFGTKLSLIDDDMTEQGYNWSSWSGLPETMPDTDVTVKGSYTARTDTKYTVKHWQQNVDDNDYTLYNTVESAGTTGALTTAEAATYEGFTAVLPIEQKTIEADGSTIVNIYYDRNTYSITYQIVDSGEFNNNAYATENNVKFGTPLTVIQDDMTQAGYKWNGWDELPDTMPAANVVITGSYTAMTDITYMVKHYQQNVEQTGYGKPEVETLAGTTGQDTQASAKNYPGFTAKAFEQQKIAGDGSTVVEIYYDRNSYTVSYDLMGGVAADGVSYNAETYVYGAPVTVKDAPSKEYYTFLYWSGEEDSITYTGTFNMPAKDITLVANWKASNRQVTVSKVLAAVNGEAYAAGNEVTVGDELTYTVTVTNIGNVDLYGLTVIDPKLPGGSMTIDSLLVGSEPVVISYKYTVTHADAVAGKVSNTAIVKDGDQELTSDTEETRITARYTVTTSIDHGTITATTTYNAGEDAVVSFTVNKNYSIKSVTVDGVPTADYRWDTTAGAYVITFPDINADHTVAVTTSRDADPAPEENVMITKTADVTTAEVGDTITYTVKVVNLGGDLDRVTVEDELDAASSIDVGKLPVGVSYSEKTGKFTIKNLAEDGRVTFTYTYTVLDEDAGETLTNTVKARIDGMFSDDDSARVKIKDVTAPTRPTIPTRPSLNTQDHVAYIIGYEDGTVRPQNNITRAEVATIFFRLLTDESRAYFWSQTNEYTDVNSGDWFNNAVSTLSNAGIVTGYPDGAFRPNAPITRAEFSAIAARFSDVVYSGNSSFTDVSASHWAARYIALAEHLGWITGYEDGTFKPDQNITRAEAMTLINRVLERAVEEQYMLPDMVTWIDNLPEAWYYEAVQEATNSHEYFRLFTLVPGQDFRYEHWQEILNAPDWAALEKAWSTVNGK